MSTDNMAAKTELGGGNHPTSASFGLVYSDHETDAAGNGPEHFAAKAEERMAKARGEKTEKRGGAKKSASRSS